MQQLAAQPAGVSRAPALLRNYLPIPPQLLADLRDHPRAVGVYALIARLYLIHHTPIPLSANDLCVYDPTLSYGAARRALQRLVSRGWLIETTRYKHQYLPTWGRTRTGELRPWAIDARALGCRPIPLRCVLTAACWTSPWDDWKCMTRSRRTPTAT
ncbi:MAG: hypothetical protein HC828_07250 [Blastochloris sp.]|nr:hypothetical protein [Blastochloris sp.]